MTEWILIPTFVLYVIGFVVWTTGWTVAWFYDDKENPEAARNVLMAPIWPLPATRTLARLYVELRHDAKED